MRRIGLISMVSLAFAAAAPHGAVSAQELLESYVARLSSADHFNSNGQRLTTVAAIIRQDRANFHRFGVRDREDKRDEFFADQSNRAVLERMLARGQVSPRAADAIINGTPLIQVEVRRDAVGVFVTVQVLEE